MRILFLSNHVANEGHGGSGWLTSLADELKERDNITLAIGHLSTRPVEKEQKDNITYYAIPLAPKGIKDKLKGLFFYNSMEPEEKMWNYYIEKCRDIVDDFHPDIIQVFGSELYCGLIAGEAPVPVILHIQGFKNACLPMFFPPGITERSYVWQDKNPYHAYRNWTGLTWWRRNAHTENEIIRKTKYFIGRTSWDKKYITLFNPQAQYFYGEEMMRPVFYQHSERVLPPRLTIMTVISAPLYKGYDNILKTANVLKNVIGIDFVWNVFGNVNYRLIEKRIKLSHKNLNVRLKGVAPAEIIKKELEKSTLYFHSSYIENSSNSVIEAQMTGCPVVANYVGGLTTIIKEGINGFLVPANDPYQAASRVLELFNDKNKNLLIGKQAREIALKQHDREVIVDELISTYLAITEKECLQNQN